MSMVYELKVTLKDVGVPVWRKIQVDSHTSFYDLHLILQTCFDWLDSHLHHFDVRKTNGKKVENVLIEPPDDGEDDFGFFGSVESFDEQEETVEKWLKQVNDKVIYTYDFGDNWEHEIVLLKKVSKEVQVEYPRCIGAKNLAPEEDSRGEVIMGQVDLEYPNAKALIKEINLDLKEIDFDQDSAQTSEPDYWKELLLKSKEFHKLSPWRIMTDDMIFAIEDPVSEELLFCSVMGQAGEMFGLAVYIGEEGYRSLLRTTQGENTMSLIVQMRSITLNFEDREELEKEEYTLIKTYDVPFRGRKSWPSYRSYQPGFYPWLMDNEEARLMLLAVEQAIEVFKEIEAGMRLPDFLDEDVVCAKVPYEKNGGIAFDNEFILLENYGNEASHSVELAVSELEVKRAAKLKKVEASIEFVVEYIDMPLQEEEGQRPIFPLLALAVDHQAGLIIHQSVIPEKRTPEVVQGELLKFFQSIGGIPGNLMIDEQTVQLLGALKQKLNLSIQTDNYYSMAKEAIEEMQSMSPF
ncbi:MULTISPECIES: plasmid pRiA4b ORF-3 family protein [Bacillaceae]|uniref:Plasmid pRiA4b ORF-3 family protein n=1 Tax=Evansella alkalicola TaxID=745819 RepID=A0ABS6K0S8_9BACI|nr:MULTISPECIES: plasmid pRiA4b ORF-3 family protein [Bacillaceae]MBU9723539.1 plasmid pRiA4b ORF-3 family protein [Bacillus alkalicola]